MGDPTTHPWLLNKRAWSHRWRDRAKSIYSARRAMAAISEASSSERREAGMALRTLAWQSRWRGTLTSAERECDLALAMMVGQDMGSVAAGVEASRAIIFTKRGAYDKAASAVKDGLNHACRRKDPESYLDLIVVEADVLRAMGNRTSAVTRLEEARDIASGCEIARVQFALGRYALLVGDKEESLVAALSAVASARRWGNMVILPRALALLGAVHRVAGRHDRAESCLNEAADLAARDGDICAECEVLHQLGALSLGRGTISEGVTLLETGRRLASRMGYVIRQQAF
ncbi:MAG: hypothetical protein AAF566_13805, partial [Pseudomonadota bacterium]